MGLVRTKCRGAIISIVRAMEVLPIVINPEVKFGVSVGVAVVLPGGEVIFIVKDAGIPGHVRAKENMRMTG